MFNLHKYFKQQYLLESDFPKNKWAYLDDEEKVEHAKDIFDLINNAYSKIGGHPNYKSEKDVSQGEKDAKYLVIDFDGDEKIDALKVVKDKPAGKKFTGTGHDGTSKAKSAVVAITTIMLKKPGYYIEVSGKIQDILIAKGVPIVKDKKTIEKVLKGKDIKLNDDGSYQRKIGGKEYTKILMGNPL